MRALAIALLVAATPANAAAPTPEASSRKAQADERRDAGDNTGALAGYREALKLSPDYIEAWEEIGKLYFGAKNFREASAAFQRAVEIDASFANNWFNLALASRRGGDLGRARDAFRKYLQIKPDDADAKLRLADVLRALNEREPAIREYQAVVDAADARKVEPALGDRARSAIAQLRAEGAAGAPLATSPVTQPPPSIPLPSP
ncbi:MAG: tetratricopeptide repeat protein, partial [Anaeromyxobacteraceae bacterium]